MKINRAALKHPRSFLMTSQGCSSGSLVCRGARGLYRCGRQTGCPRRDTSLLSRRTRPRSFDASCGAISATDIGESITIVPDVITAAIFASEQIADLSESTFTVGATVVDSSHATLFAELSALTEITGPQRMEGILSPVSDLLEEFVLATQRYFSDAGVRYPLGSSIIFTTFVVKALTYPFTKVQVESALNMQNLQPQVNAVREKYKDDQEQMNIEINRLYEDNQVSPLAGCGPLLLTLPVVWGLYRAFNNASIDGSFDEPWFFIPSLAGPTPDRSLAWLLPLDDNYQPPLGWHDASLYLVVPILTVASQYVSMSILSPVKDLNDPNTAETEQQSFLLNFLPLFIGYISLTVPAGLTLYWLFNNIFTTATQVYLRQGGGAVAKVEKIKDVKLKVPLGCAIVDQNSTDQLSVHDVFEGPYVLVTDSGEIDLAYSGEIDLAYSALPDHDKAYGFYLSPELRSAKTDKWRLHMEKRGKRSLDPAERYNATPEELRLLISEYLKLGMVAEAEEISVELGRLGSETERSDPL